jgi:hypothetical protein
VSKAIVSRSNALDVCRRDLRMLSETRKATHRQERRWEPWQAWLGEKAGQGRLIRSGETRGESRIQDGGT